MCSLLCPDAVNFQENLGHAESTACFIVHFAWERADHSATVCAYLEKFASQPHSNAASTINLHFPLQALPFLVLGTLASQRADEANAEALPLINRASKMADLLSVGSGPVCGCHADQGQGVHAQQGAPHEPGAQNEHAQP